MIFFFWVLENGNVDFVIYNYFDLNIDVKRLSFLICIVEWLLSCEVCISDVIIVIIRGISLSSWVFLKFFSYYSWFNICFLCGL